MKNNITLSLVTACLIVSNLNAKNMDQDLNAVTVYSATKSEQNIKDVTSNIEVITKSQLEEKNITTVSEALRTLPGISIISNGGLGKSTSVFMRGFDSQRILVLIDGIRYNDFTGISGARFEHLMINDIKQIEVIKGAQSGIWGADANAGVINIITSTSEKGTRGSILMEYGSFNTKKLAGKISHKTENFDVSVALTRLESDGFTSVAPRGVNIDKFEDDGYKNTTINAKVGYNFDDNNRLVFSHNIIKAKSQYDSGFGSDEDKADTKGYELETNNQFTSLQFTNNNKYSDINVYGNYTKIDRDDPLGFTKEFDGNMKEFGINTKVPYLKDAFLSIGVDYKESTHENDTNKTLKNKGIFITNSNRFEKLVFTQSLRYDTYDLFDNKTTGKIGLKYDINENFYISSNIGTSYNVPTFYKLYDSFVGYSDLQPETTKSFDLSLNYNDLKLTYFKTKIDNMIEYNSSSYKYYNIAGTVRLEGLEISYSKLLLSDLLVSLNYTYTRAKDDKDMDLQRRAKQSFKFGFDYYGVEKLHLGLYGEYVGTRKQYSFGTYDVTAQTGNYTVANAVINYDLTKNIKIYTKIDNITNKYYQTIDGFSSSPRAYYAGLKYSF